MPATFNHTIVAAQDRELSARFWRELLELGDAPGWGPFRNLMTHDGVLLQFAEPPVEIQSQHYAFLVDEELFDRAVADLRSREQAFWADPHRTCPGETNTEHGGRGVYLLDPAGHFLELTTRPYV